MDKLPKKVFHKNNKCAYLVTIDRYHRETYKFKGDDGNEYSLFTPKSFTMNYNKKNVNECTVVKTYGDASFKEGDKLVVDHWLFMDNNNNVVPPLITIDGVDYYRVLDGHVYCGIVNGETIPNGDLLIAEYIEYPKLSDKLNLVGEFTGKRRDVVKITKVPSNEDKFKEGQLIMIEDYGDYGIWDGTRVYLIISKSDIIGIVEDDNLRKVKYIPFPEDWSDDQLD